MANDNHLFSVTLYNVTMISNKYYNEFFELGQQKINFNFFELSLPDDDPVYTLKKVMEDLDFTNLLAQYSDKGRNGFNPIMKYAVLTYANMRGVRAVDRIVELLKLQKNLVKIADGEGISFVYEKRQKKSEIQKLYDELEECGKRLMKYKDCFEIMGSDRNSYSKTDLEATFMRMKEDHMLNGQLKPAYNVQIAVENYFIIHGYVSNDRTDYNTLIPVIRKHQTAFGKILKEVTADSGYCSEKNLLYLKENDIASFIKLQDHEQRKTRAYKEDIGKHYNMTYQIFEDEHYYVCHDGRELRHVGTETRKQDVYTQTFEVYTCADCSGCEHKAKCLYKYNPEKDADKNKVMKINEQWEELKASSHANIESEKGILNRQIRSIQTEGHFGDIKENENFRRFNHRSTEKVYKEFMLYAIGRNINKYHRFLHKEIQKFEGKQTENAA